MLQEDINEAFKIENIDKLAKNINEALPKLNKDLEILKTTKSPKEWKNMSVFTYKTLIKDLWSLKESSHEFLNKLKFGLWDHNKFKDIVPICGKILSIWSGNQGNVYGKLLEIDKVIDNIYNKKFPNNKLCHVEDLIGIPIRASVTTEEVNYFPY